MLKVDDDVNDKVINRLITLFTDSVFGADLSEELAKSHTEAPLVVMKCVEEIEKACSDHGRCINV